MNQPRSQFFSNMAPYRGGFEDEDYMEILVCRVWTRRNITAFVLNFHCATNAHFQKKKDEIPGYKAEKFVAYCVPSSKEAFGEENASQFVSHFHCFVHERTCSILSLCVLIIYA